MQEFTFEEFLKPSLKKVLLFVGIFFLMYLLEIYFGKIFLNIYCTGPCPEIIQTNLIDVITGYSFLFTNIIKLSMIIKLAGLLIYYYAIACVIDFAYKKFIKGKVK